MSEPFGSLFTTGQFAALCGTTKDTLFHYDRIGLLKPRNVGSNGYRRYTSAQLFDFDLIRVLQQAGSTLEEIKWYRQHYDSAHFLLLLEEKQAGIRARLEQLARMEQMLAHVAATTRRALAETYDVPRAEPQQAEQLLVVGLKKGEGEHTDGVAARVSEHLALCEKHRLTDRFPLGSVILKEDVLAGSSLESYFFQPGPAGFFQAGRCWKNRPAFTPPSCTRALWEAFMSPITHSWPMWGGRAMRYAATRTCLTSSPTLPAAPSRNTWCRSRSR